MPIVRHCPHDQILGQDIDHLTLDNSFQAYLVKEPNIDSVAVMLDVLTPSKEERSEFCGRAFLTGCSLSCGSGNYPNPDEFREFFADSKFTVFLTMQSTQFFYTIDSGDLDESLKRFSDAISLPELPRNSAKFVKDRISKYYHSYTGDSTFQIMRQEELLYGAPSPAYFELLDQPNFRNRIHEFLARFYKPSNMRLVIAYDDSISRDEVIKLVTDNFEDIADQRMNVMGGDDYLNFDLGDDSTAATMPTANKTSVKLERDTPASEHPTADNVVAVSQVYASTDEQILWITFATPVPSYSSELYWNYVLSSTGEGSLGFVLQSHQLITGLKSISYLWDVAGEASRRTIKLHLSEKGAENVAFILSLFFKYVSIVTSEEISYDAYASALQYNRAENLQDLAAADSDINRWRRVMGRFLECDPELRDTTFDPLSIAEEARHFVKDKCSVIHASETFRRLDREPSSEFFLIHGEVSIPLPPVPENSGLRFPDRPIALPTSLAMSIKPSYRGRSTGFVELNQNPLVVQNWHAGHDLVMKLKLPLTPASGSACRVLASALNTHLRSSGSKGLFSGSAKYAGGALDITVRCFPDALMAVVGALLTSVKTKCSLTGEELAGIKDSLSAEFNSHLEDQDTPSFDSDFEQLIGLRSFESELADLKSVTADTLPSIEPGYFALLLVGNVNRALTDEVARTVAYFTSTKMTNGPYRPVTTESLPENIFASAPVVRSLLPAPHEGSAFLFAFRLGDYTTEMMAKAVAFASIAATVVRQDLGVGNLIAPHTESKAVHARGHVWLVIEVIGHRGFNYVAPFVNESLIKSMKKAFKVLNEDDMVAARGRARKELFELRDTMEEEADRLWHPMYWAGEPYVLETIEALDATKPAELSDWYFDLVQSGETRECVTIFYKRKGFPDPPASEELEVVEAESQSDSDSD